MTLEKKEITLRHWMQLVLMALIWGSSFIIIKRALVHLTPIQLASFRVAFTAIPVIPYIIYIRKEIDWSRWWQFLLLGLTTTGIPSFCFAFAQKYMGSATVGILNSLTPIITLLVGVWFFKQEFKMSKLLGVVLGFIGAGLLVYKSGDGNFSSNLTGFSIILFATICYGFNGNFVKHYFHDLKPLVVSAGAFTMVGIPIIIFLLCSPSTYELFENKEAYAGLGWVMILGLVCTLIANLFFYDLVQKTNAVFSSSVTFLIPIVASLWAMWDGESLNIFHFLSLLFILSALLILRRN